MDRVLVVVVVEDRDSQNLDMGMALTLFSKGQHSQCRKISSLVVFVRCVS